ncbi:hypothetical protein AB6809_35645 [Paraburkholderia sp. RCC_158]|uniref:hypothetical protein n=1 Tax=Paraburkholderia sp. RCC_158 TaxID=3239220 RepID=UPI0035252212
MRVIEHYREWTLDIISVADSGMFTANAIITRESTDSDSGFLQYTFRNLGVSDMKELAIRWAAEWLGAWIDDNHR